MGLRLMAGLVASWAMGGQTPPTPEPAVIRSTSRLVNVNVLAFDKKGNPVRDLKAEDFVVTDSGVGRPISLFAVETVDGHAGTQAPAAPGTFTNRVEEKASSVTIFLFDGLNTRVQDQAFAKADLLKYLKELEPNDRVALFSLGRELLLVHDFTSDAKALVEAINKQGTRLNQEVASGEPMAANTGDGTLNRMLNNSNQGIADYTNELRAVNTAAALEAIAAHAARLPGRKNLVWVSGGFPMMVGFGQRNSTNRQTFGSAVDRAVRALNDADIAVYPVDARRLEAQPVNSENGGVARPLSARGQTQAVAVASKDNANIQPMEELANGTGGKAFYNVNDLGAAIRTAIADARVSYALGFTPADGALDGRFHRIKVTTKRAGVQLRYREGYFGYPDPPQISLAQAIASPAEFTGVGITVGLKPDAKGGTAATLNFDAKNLTLEKIGNDYQVRVEMLFITGKLPVAPRSRVIMLKIGADAREMVLRDGLLVGTALKTADGPVEYHIGVRDMLSGAIGTLHLTKN